MNKHFAEIVGLKQIAQPQDINGVGLTGDRIEMGKGHKIAIEILCNNGAGEIDLSLQQHDAASGGNSKVLNIKNHYYIKKDAETSFTKTEVDLVANPTGIANAVSGVAGVKGVIVVEVLDTDLDINNGFNHISLNIASPGANAKIVAGSYKVFPRFSPAYELDL